MTATKSLVFRIEDVEVRESEYCVIRRGEVLAIEPKAFRVLLFLLRNPQRVVSKEELLNAVWGDAAVTENSLARSVLKLRKALDDEIREPRFIETVATVGYRLICPVDAVEELASPMNGIRMVQPAVETEPFAPPRGSEIPPESPGVQRTRSLWLLGAIALVGIAVAAIWYMHRPLPPQIVSYTQLTHDSRRKGLFAVDASRLYLTFYADINWIGQTSTSGGPIVKIPTAIPTPWVMDATADGTRLLVLSSDPSSSDHAGAGLWSVDTVGNVQQMLARGEVVSAAWSPDGRSAVFTRPNGDIETLAADGSGLHKIANVPIRSDHGMMDRISWSPDGRVIRFDTDDRIYELAADGSGGRPFLREWHPGSNLCCGRWTRDGSFYLFLEWPKPSAAYPLFAPSQIWAIDERRGFMRSAAKEPVQLTTGPMRWGGPMPSITDGKQIFARGVTLSGQLERVNLHSHQLEPLFGGLSAEFVDFSPDGKYVSWVTFPEGILWRANRDGSDPIRLTNPPFYPTQTRWSPDSSALLVYGRDGNGLDKMYLISPVGGTPRPLLADDPDEQINPSWSPDGKKIVMSWSYASDKEPLSEIKIYDLATRQITTVPGSTDLDSPRWSPDGEWLSGVNIHTTELLVFNFKAQHWTSVMKGNNDYPIWSHHGGYLYFLHDLVDTGIYRFKPGGGAAERVVDLKGFRFASYYGGWLGLDLDDAPMVLRDVGGDDIYSLRFNPN